MYHRSSDYAIRVEENLQNFTLSLGVPVLKYIRRVEEIRGPLTSHCWPFGPFIISPLPGKARDTSHNHSRAWPSSSLPSRNDFVVPLPPVEVLAVEYGGQLPVRLLPYRLVGHAVEEDVNGVVQNVKDVHNAPQRQVGSQVEARLLGYRPGI